MRSNCRILGAAIARVALLLVLGALSTSGYPAAFSHVWPAERIAALQGGSVRLLDKNKNVIDTLPISTVRSLLDVKRRITQQAGIDAELFVVDGDSPNAFATRVNEKNVIGFNIPMLKAFGHDTDAIAAVMGHEVAHLVRGHGVQRQETDAVLGIIGLIAGLALDHKLSRRYGTYTDLGSTLTSLGATLVARSFTRDQEREADDHGLRYTHAAGFSAAGAVRLWENMPQRGFSFFATHPPTAERVQNIRTVLATLLPQRVDSSTTAETRPSQPATAGTIASVAEFKEDSSASDDPFILALNAFRQGRYEDALRHAMVSAEKGDPRGQFGLGYLHLYGRGTPKDYPKAAEYFRLAAAQESALAITYLGIMYELGWGFQRDPSTAAEFYGKAAAADFPHAVARLASLKLVGRGVARDPVEAVALASKAATANDALGQYVLGVAYYQGQGIEQDYTKAREFFESTAARGFGPSNTMLGLIYSQGRGVTKNYETAASFYRKAIEKNDATGKASLGFLYLSGRGVSRDVAEARRLFDEAHQQGNSVGTIGLGQVLRDGIGVEKDPVRALAFFDLAVRRGAGSAAKLRDDLTRLLSEEQITTARKLADSMHGMR